MMTLLAYFTLLCLAVPAVAQSIQPIYSFTNGPATPEAGLTLGLDGNFYGTTRNGGSSGSGTVFRITTNGILNTLYSFSATAPRDTTVYYTNADGAGPVADLRLASDGSFYGTTLGGGTSGRGTVFQITTNGTLTTLASFNGTNGAGPDAGLTFGPDGNLYGTTFLGGSGDSGTIFKITTNGVLTTLYSFTATLNNSNTDGANPLSELVLGPDDNFYGTTLDAGKGGFGTVFRITIDGKLTTLASFNFTNGSSPEAGLALGSDGNFYGTTFSGGSGGYQDGTVFRITTNGSLTTLANFAYPSETFPYARLLLGPDGSFYGTTENGGSSDLGTIFRITTNGTLSMLASFNGANGSYPVAALTLGPDGNLYGTAQQGGINNHGTLFKITTNGTLTTLVSFADTYGAIPYAGLTVAPDGNFYGTTVAGGSRGYGTAFQITTNGVLTTLASFALTNGAAPRALTFGPDGNLYGTTYGYDNPIVSGSSDGTVFRLTTNGTLTTLYSFGAINDYNFTNASGAYPNAGLTLGSDGTFYGTTQAGGSQGFGTLFQINSNGGLATLVNFANSNGAYPESGLTVGPDGNFYGTTYSGGASNYGTIFEFTPDTLTTLVSFDGANGAYPLASVTLGPDGNFYGITFRGGSGNGTVFIMTSSGSLTTLATIPGTNGYGIEPQANLILGPDGNFYGTTYVGGSGNYGTAFQITTNGTLTFLASFASTNGSYPQAALTLGSDGNFYGTTSGGGIGGGGVIYRLNLPPSILTQPSSQIVAFGSNATFTVGTFGTAPFGYQWLFNSMPIADATNSTLAINVTPSSAGNYQVIVTNAWGSVTSSLARLTLPIPPTITNQPASETVRIGGTANFAVGATGTPPLAYQWYFSHQSHASTRTLPGATNAALSFGPVLPNQRGNYQVIVTSPYGSVTSSPANLTVVLQPNLYAISNTGSRSMTLLLASTPDSTNRLWSSTNLNLPFAQWRPIATNIADPTGLFQFIDTNTGSAPAKFYILSTP